jgi:hydrogenase expression/formation protein HypC
MCLAIPGKIVGLPAGELQFALVDVSGVRRKVIVDMLPEPPAIGDWVLVHVGFAMNTLSEHEAQEQLELMRRLGEDLEEEFSSEVEMPP